MLKKPYFFYLCPLKVESSRRVDAEGDMPNGWYSGRDRGEGYENGTVYLSNNPAKAVEFVFGHEIYSKTRKRMHA